MLEECSAAPGNVIAEGVQNLGAKVRRFLRSCDDFEGENQGKSEGGNIKDKEERENIYSNFELAALHLVKKLKLQAESSKTPKSPKAKKRRRATFINPVKGLKKRMLACPYCPKTYEGVNIKSLQNHVRNVHGAEKKVSTNDFQEEEDNIICQLLKKNGNICSAKVPKDQVSRKGGHFESKRAHKSTTPRPQGTKFRGFRFIDGKDPEVVWLHAGAVDPPSEDELEIDSEEEVLSASNKRTTQQKIEKYLKPLQVEKIPNGDPKLEVYEDVDFGKEEEPSDVEQSTISILVQECVAENPVVMNKEYAAIASPEEILKDMDSFPQAEDNEVALDDGKTIQDVDMVDSGPPETIEESELMIDADNYEPIPESVTKSSSIVLCVNPVDVNKESEEVVIQEEVLEEDLNPPDLISDKLMSSVALNVEHTGVSSAGTVVEGNEFNQEESHDNDTKISENLELGSQELVLTSGERDNSSQETIQSLLTPPKPESLEEDDLIDEFKVINYVSTPVPVQIFKQRMKKGTIWSDPSFDNYFNQPEPEAPSNDAAPVESIDMLDLEPEKELSKDAVDVETTESTVSYEEAVIDSESEPEAEEDSDYDENFDIDHETLRNRQEMRKIRHSNRDKAEQVDLAEQPENSCFISQFLDWLKSITSMSTAKKDPSTFNLSTGHGWQYFDSFLNYHCSVDPSFNLQKLIDFKNPSNFSFIPSPVEWILKANGNPSRQREQLNLHKRFRNFIKYMMLKANFDGQNVNLKIAISQHLNSIDEEISNNKFYQKLKKQYENDRAKTRQMRQIVTPDSDEIEYDAVKTFLNSEEAKKLLKEVDEIYEKTMEMENKKIRPNDFNKVANTVRFFIAVKDKNRPSVYGFTNADYLAKVPAWLPDSEEYIWSLDDLPKGWKLYQPPAPGVPPTCFEVRLSGTQAGIKGQAQTNVILDRDSFQLAEKFQKLKRVLFDKLEPSSPFFVNSRGNQLSRLQKQPGSLVELFGKVTKNPHFNMTSIRKGLEGKIRNQKDAEVQTKAVNNHSNAVMKTYDNASAMRRNIFLNSVSALEGVASSSTDADFKKVYEESVLNSKEDVEEMKAEAQTYLEDQKKEKNKVNDLTPSSLSEDDIQFLKDVFDEDDNAGTGMLINKMYTYLNVQVKTFFPGQWQKRFYQTVDSDTLPSATAKKLREIEAQIFQIQKRSILKEMKQKEWKGSKEENSFADKKISYIVQSIIFK